MKVNNSLVASITFQAGVSRKSMLSQQREIWFNYLQRQRHWLNSDASKLSDHVI
jgi:hypothetical protein